MDRNHNENRRLRFSLAKETLPNHKPNSPFLKAPGDVRVERYPKFQGDNLSTNLKAIDEVKKIAAENKVTMAQLSLAWVCEVAAIAA